jgi:monoterpene epsilon-lactone hydrolase
MVMLTLLKLIKQMHLPLSGLKYVRLAIQVNDFFYHPSPDIQHIEDVVYGVKTERVFLKRGLTERVIFYIHGGAFIVGMNSVYQKFAETLSRLTHSTVILIDYGVAPENPFPIGLEQCIGVYQQLLKNGISPKDIIVMGDSAGGGLALSTLVAAKDRNIPLPSAAVLFSPWVDLTLSNDSYKKLESLDPIIPVDRMSEVVSLYLKNESPLHPLASPLFADLKGLPPLYISLGTHEVLHGEGKALAKKATDAGVSVTLDIQKRMMHVYPILIPRHPQSKTTFRKIKEFISQIT